MRSASRRKLFLCRTFTVGALSLSCVAGSAVMNFHLPSRGFFQKALMGAAAWRENEQNALAQQPTAPVIMFAQAPDKAFDGYPQRMVPSQGSASDSEDILVDMNGQVNRKWKASFETVICWFSTISERSRLRGTSNSTRERRPYPGRNFRADIRT